MKKKDKEYINSLKEYIVTAEGRVKYSLERFDILIISLSSGGLALSNSIYENFHNGDKIFINIAWIFFSSALIINLLSQITGYKANKLDIKCTRIVIDEVKGKAEEGSHKKLDYHKGIYNSLTKIFNILSFSSLTIAIILITLFINLNNNHMSDKDKDKNQSGKGEQNRQGGNPTSQERSERSETTRKEWDKIDKKGHGSGDRPKRD
jgi:hypothetical protein